MFNTTKKNIFNSMILSALFSGLFSALIIYYLQRNDNKNNWCVQEVKNFNKNNYDKKDLLILSEECKDQIKKYKLLSHVLLEGNDTKKIASVINELYIDKDIDTDFIIDQRNSIAKSVENNTEHYNGNNNENIHYSSTPDKALSTYLVFMNELSINTLPNEYKDNDQIDFYFNIFSKFFHNSQWIFKFNQSVIDESNPQNFKLLQTDDFINLKKIVRNIGKNENAINKKEGNSDQVTNALTILFNSYLSKNRKKELIFELKKISNLLKNEMSAHRLQHGIYVNQMIFESDDLIALIFEELNSYNLSENELKEIFEIYTNLIENYRPSYSFEKQNKLFYALFSERKDVFNTLISNNYQNANIKSLLSDDFLKYIALLDNCDLLQNLLNDSTIRSDVVSAIITGSKNDDMWNNHKCTDISIKLFEDEQRFPHKKNLMSRAVFNANYQMVEYTIDYMNKNKQIFLNDLNTIDLSIDNRYLGSIYFSLAKTKVDQYPVIKKKKLDLYIFFFQNTKNKHNKDLIFNIIKSFLSNSDDSASDKIFEMVENEKEKHYKESFLHLYQNKLNN